MSISRRTAIAGLGAVAAAPHARAQDFPNKPIRLVVPFAAGSATDIAARGLGQKLGDILKQGVVIENKPGAGGQLGAQAVATAAPDGYTLLMGTNSTNAAIKSLYKKPLYDQDKDFAAIARVVLGVNTLVANPQIPVNNVAELVEYAKKNPGKINYAEASSSQRLTAEMFNQLSGAKLERVPYRASPQALQDVISGQVQVMFPDLPNALPQIEAGRVKGLGVSSAKRTSVAPNLPAIAETLPGYELVWWLAVFAPAATPRPILQRLAAAVQEGTADAATGRTMTGGRAEVSVIVLDEFQRFVTRETDVWAKAIKAAGIEPE